MNRNFIKPFQKVGIKLSILSALIFFVDNKIAVASPALDSLFKAISAGKSADADMPGRENTIAVPDEANKDIQITGTVKSANGQPLPDVTVSIKNTSFGTKTDANGYYKINAPDKNSILVFSHIGYTSQEVKVGNKTSFDIVLQENGKSLEEVVVIAYGTQKKASVTGAVSTVKGDVLAESPVANISNALAGNVAGVSMRPNGGQPGMDNPVINVRGVGTYGNNAPLVVIDGVQRNNINEIDPEAVENVTILKDAAAVAPYGLGGANGVILITTKRGKTGAPILTLNSFYGIQNSTYVPKTLNAQQYMQLTDEAYLNDNPGLTNTLPYATSLINNYQNLHNQDPVLYPESDAYNQIAKRNDPESKTDLQLSGGTKDVKYFAGVGIFNQQGMVTQMNYRRYNYNLNLDVNATSTTTVSLGITGAFENTNSIDQGTPTLQFVKMLLKYEPNQALQYPNGDYAQFAGDSPLGLLNSGSYYRKNQSTELMTISVEQKLNFIPGLSAKVAFSYDPISYQTKNWHEPYYYYSVNTNTKPYTYTQGISTSEGFATQYISLSQAYQDSTAFTYQAFLNYHHSFGKSDVTGLVVAEEKNFDQNNFSAGLNNYTLDIDELNFGSSLPTDRSVGGSSSSGSQVGYVYRVDYAYDGKYLFEGSGRYDGHYFFAPGHQYAFFPAFSAGWVLSKENFMAAESFFDYLKLRASWGKAGNLAGGPFEYISGYTLYGNSYAFGAGNLVQGSYQAQEANPNLTWEISTKTDLGLEAKLFKGLLNVDADFFFERRTGILLPPNVTVPVEYGLGLAPENAGILNNHGFELTLGTQHRFDNGITFALNGNFSYSRNKVIQDFESATTYNNPNTRRTGRPYGEVFGYKAIGLFPTSADKNNDGVIDSKDGYNVTQFGTLHPGDVEFEDVNHDGKIDINDQVPIANPNYPAITYGFTPTVSWKGVDISLFFQGAALESFDINGFQTVPFLNNDSNTALYYYDNRWTPTNQGARLPRATEAPSTNNQQTSSFWYVNTGYLRLKTATIGYTFPTSIAKKIGMSHLRLYATGQNVLTFSELSYMDPEIGYQNGELSYPNQRVFITGLSASF